MPGTQGENLARLAHDFAELQKATKAHGWAKDDEDTVLTDPASISKPIPPETWMRTFLLVMGLTKSLPGNVPLPIPGANPGGWITLTWVSPDERRMVDLEMLPDGTYRWTHKAPGGEPRKLTSGIIDDVAESIRDVFRGHLIS